MSLSIQGINIGDNFRIWRERFNELIGKTNSSLQDNQNLSDVLDVVVARDNLKVLSVDEATDKFLDTSLSFKEIADAGTTDEARTNLDVYSKSEGDNRYFEESKLLSEVVDADKRTLANNIDMYLKTDLFTKSESNDNFLQTSDGSINNTTANSYFTDYKRDGVYNLDNSNLITGASNYGSILQATPSGAGSSRFQLYAPDVSKTTDDLTNVETNESGMWVKTGRGTDSESWTQMLSTEMGNNSFFKKSKLFSEISGALNTTYRRTATDNLDVYQKGDVYTQTESNNNYHNKSVTYTRVESDGRYLLEGNNLSDLTNKSTARNNLDVYSTTEVVDIFMGKAANLSDLVDKAESRDNLDVYQKSDVFTQAETDTKFYSKTESDTNYYNKSDLYTKTVSDGRYLLEGNNLSDLTSKSTARDNLDVYSKTEATTKFTEDGSNHNAGDGVIFGKFGANVPRISSTSNKLTINHSSSNDGMHVNYEAPEIGFKTPNKWYWHDGTSTSYTGFEIGNTNIHGDLSTTGKLTIGSDTATLNGKQIATKEWSGDTYYTQSEVNGRIFDRTDINNLFDEISGAKLTDTQRAIMLSNFGVYTKAEIDANFETGATNYLSQSSNLSDLANTAVARNNLGLGSAALSSLSTSGSTSTLGSNGVNASVARLDHEHYTVGYKDNRSVNSTPSDYMSNGKNQFNEFKTSSVLGVAGEKYSYVVTQVGWNDDTGAGGFPKQTVYNQGRIKQRFGVNSNDWSDWKTVAFLDDKVADSSLLDGKSLSHVLDYSNFTNVPSFASDTHNHDGRYLLIDGKAADADKLDGLNSSQFMRMDVAVTKSVGDVKFNDNVKFNYGTGNDVEQYFTGTHLLTDINTNSNWYIRDNATSANKFIFNTAGGSFYATGSIYEGGNKLSEKYLGLTANSVSASKLKTARTITLGGDVDGSFAFDGTANKSFNVTVADDSHTHDGRYYTETESDARFLKQSGGNITGELVVDGVTHSTGLELKRYDFSTTGDDVVTFDVTDNSLDIVIDNANDGQRVEFNVYGKDADAVNVEILNATMSNTFQYKGLNVYRENYHPYADKLTTARTITIDGDATGSVSFDGSANKTITLDVNTADKLTTARTITATGDVSGSMTFDGSANKSFALTVANDSHTHDGRYYTEAESDAKYFSKTDGGDVTGDTKFKGVVGFGDEVTTVSNYILTLSVNKDTPKPITNDNGTNVYDGAVYELHIGCLSTGTTVDTTSYLWNTAGVWYVSNNIAGDKTSNYPWVFVDVDGIPKLINGHNNIYTYTIVVTKTLGVTGTQRGSSSFFGIGARFSSDSETVYLNHERFGESDRTKLYTDEYHPQSDKLSTARTITATGDVSGSMTFDGSENKSLALTVANDSHTHDGRYYTEAESDAKYLPSTTPISSVVTLERDSGTALRIGSDANGASDIDIEMGNGLYNWKINYHGEGIGVDNSLQFLSSGTSGTGAGFEVTHEGNMYALDSAGNRAAIWNSRNDGNGSGLDADKLDGLHGSQFLRTDVTTTKTAGSLKLNRNISLGFGDNSEVRQYFNGTNHFMDINSGSNWYIGDINDRYDTFTFDVANTKLSVGDANDNNRTTVSNNEIVVSNTLQGNNVIIDDSRISVNTDATSSYISTGGVYDDGLRVYGPHNKQPSQFSTQYILYQNVSGLQTGDLELAYSIYDFEWLIVTGSNDTGNMVTTFPIHVPSIVADIDMTHNSEFVLFGIQAGWWVCTITNSTNLHTKTENCVIYTIRGYK